MAKPSTAAPAKPVNRLSAEARKKLPTSQFAGPNRSFPIPDKAHAVAAERLVGRAQKAGSITAAQAATIKAKAQAELAKGAKAPAAAKLDAKHPNAASGKLGKKPVKKDNDDSGFEHHESMKPYVK